MAFGSVISTLLLMGALSHFWVVIPDQIDRSVRDRRSVLESRQDLNPIMESSDCASRGCVLAGKESDLGNYSSSAAGLERAEAAVYALTAINPTQMFYFQVIETLIAENIQAADVVIKMRRQQRVGSAESAFGPSWDEPTIGTFQTTAGHLQRYRLRLSAYLSPNTDLYRSQTRWFLTMGTLFGMLVTFIAWRFVLIERARRKVSERASQESEAKYQMLLDGVHDYAILMLDPNGQVTGWSASAERIKGYTTEEIIGHNFSCFFPPAEIKRGRPEEVLRSAAACGLHKEVGMRVRKDGSEFLASAAFRPLRDAAGILRGFSEICHDLTEHATSEARFRELLEAAPDGMVVVNQRGQIDLLNAQAEKQFGYRRDELLGQKVTDIIPKGFAERLISDETRTSTEALAQQIGTGIELQGRCKDGTEFPIEIMLSPLDSPEGILVTVAIRDITVRKNAEGKLAQMEAKYRGLLEAAPDGMVVVKPGGEIVLLNAQVEKLFGYHRDELLGESVRNIIPVGFAERLVADALRTTAEALTQEIGSGIDLHGRRKDGTTFPIEIMLSPLESPEGTLITAAIRDVSERQQIALQLHQSQKMEAVGQLTGGIAHDFNNLLTVIIGNLGLLEQLVSSNEAAVKRIRTAQKAAARGADITRRLLAFSSRGEMRPVFVILEDSIQNMIEMASRGLGLNIKISTQLDQSVPPLFVDPAGLESALLNLVVNARDAMPKGGSIIISSLRQSLEDGNPALQAGYLTKGDYVCVSVSDTGQGMSQETVERACEPFFTTKADNKGTGLGLAMVYGFAKQSGGFLRIYSELGLGTTVSFYLPILADVLRPAPTNAAKPSNAKLFGTVLVVDDEVDLIEVALSYLAEMGLKTFEANDGISALEMLAQHREIDLLITDIVMPGGINGAELAQRAQVLYPKLKIIYSSGFPAEALGETTMPRADGLILRKPYRLLEFAAAVRSVMEAGNDTPTELECSHSD